jgi:broad specificity phosphatase PhoE
MVDKRETQCPRCYRPMQTRWLRYGHQCGRSWSLEKRGEEQAERAREAFLRRNPEVSLQTEFEKDAQKAVENDVKNAYRRIFAKFYSAQAREAVE